MSLGAVGRIGRGATLKGSKYTDAVGGDTRIGSSPTSDKCPNKKFHNVTKSSKWTRNTVNCDTVFEVFERIPSVITFYS